MDAVIPSLGKINRRFSNPWNNLPRTKVEASYPNSEITTKVRNVKAGKVQAWSLGLSSFGLVSNFELRVLILCVLALLLPLPAPAARLVNPTNDLVYLGAFRLPGPSGGSSWGWCGYGLAYCPVGDPSNTDDYPGSLYGIGHDWETYVSEITIPPPVISPSKDVNDLPTAVTIQPFADVRAFDPGGSEQIIGDLEYLPPQGTQTSAKLHQTWGRHFQYDKCASHGWCGLVLTNLPPAGGWFVGPTNGEPSCFALNDYLFAIPEAWATQYVSGRRLATGRFREGGLSGQGPALFAIGPWESGDPPPSNAVLGYTTLLKYDDPGAGTNKLNGYLEADEWQGGAWLQTRGGKTAVVFVGTKATGDCWYGFADGSVWPDCLPDCEEFQDRGWWADGMRAQMIFFNPDDLAAVATNGIESWRPQPYAALDLEAYLFRTNTANGKRRLGDCAYDRERGLLFVFEPFADEDDKPIVHVWKLLDDPALGIGPAWTHLTFDELRPGASYDLETAAQLVPPAWQTNHRFTATGIVQRWSETSPAGRKFYRLKESP